MVRQAISRLPLVLKSGFTPSGAAVAPLDAFVCLVLNGAPCSGNELSTPHPFHFRPKIEPALLGHDPWFLCCLPIVWKNSRDSPVPVLLVALRLQYGPRKQSPCPGHIL
ncbi:hypothetical protein TIFTF001_046552 [Ficus carica]|uniref:Uncharacterized protein n=1 Tax=Ficus carica TaxID=3494 RepID=A0AA87ZBF7_FICCA|nr:hypothetical protein TIFTF001_046552 [Ficus carica]